ncbi:MAG TPA: MFS transporter [Thermomicrobiales bacterium]|nr:MFS transporter [Thermomicrobiales bacterium]
MVSVAAAPIRLGLRANWRQFALLVLINAFVGGMVGVERTVVPLLATQDYGLASRTAILAFIASFGAVKALSNLAAGVLGDRVGRRRLLIAGWLVGLPVPLLVLAAPSWGWVVAANALLGVNQGLCWSSTVVMKVDLVGPARRGLALGVNEAAGYGAVALAALASGYLAAAHGLRPAPFLLALALALAGLLLSVCCARETHGHARHEAALRPAAGPRPTFGAIFRRTSWRDRTLFAASQAGLVNNLNDGLAWGLFPLFFAAAGLGVERIGVLAALYPGVWGLGQLFTGALADRVGRKGPIVAGMWTQAAALGLLLLTRGFGPWAAAMALLGLGTALVYPTLLTVVADVAHPEWRASAVGVYRLWRDVGYVAGAILAGLLADLLGVSWAIAGVGALTFASGLVALARLSETLRRPGGEAGAE